MRPRARKDRGGQANQLSSIRHDDRSSRQGARPMILAVRGLRAQYSIPRVGERNATLHHRLFTVGHVLCRLLAPSSHP